MGVLILYAAASIKEFYEFCIRPLCYRGGPEAERSNLIYDVISIQIYVRLDSFFMCVKLMLVFCSCEKRLYIQCPFVKCKKKKTCLFFIISVDSASKDK